MRKIGQRFAGVEGKVGRNRARRGAHDQSLPRYVRRRFERTRSSVEPVREQGNQAVPVDMDRRRATAEPALRGWTRYQIVEVHLSLLTHRYRGLEVLDPISIGGN